MKYSISKHCKSKGTLIDFEIMLEKRLYGQDIDFFFEIEFSLLLK